MDLRLSPSPSGGCRRSLLALLAGALAGPLGCQSMPERKMEALVKQYNELIDGIRQRDQEQQVEEAQRLAEEAAHQKRVEQYNQAADRLASGDAKGALETVEAALARVPKPKPQVAKPKEAQPNGKQGEAATAAGVAAAPEAAKETRPAEEFFEATGSERSHLLTLKGSALSELGRNEEALQAFQQAIESDSENLLARRRLGKIHFDAQKFRPALEAWKPLLASGARDGELLYLVGQARYEVARAEGRPEALQAARLAFEAVLIERPEDPEVVRWLATLAYETGRHGE